jgi:hypothetical protein
MVKGQSTINGHELKPAIKRGEDMAKAAMADSAGPIFLVDEMWCGSQEARAEAVGWKGDQQPCGR